MVTTLPEYVRQRPSEPCTSQQERAGSSILVLCDLCLPLALVLLVVDASVFIYSHTPQVHVTKLQLIFLFTISKKKKQSILN